MFLLLMVLNEVMELRTSHFLSLLTASLGMCLRFWREKKAIEDIHEELLLIWLCTYLETDKYEISENFSFKFRT